MATRSAVGRSNNKMAVQLSIIIVNWNGADFLPNCLRSIVENPPSVLYEIVVVDNDSSDGSVTWMRSEEAAAMLGETVFRLIESGGNLGFSKGNNLAIEQTESPIVLLLNPDTVVKSGAIDKLLETLQSDEAIGACAPKLLNADGSIQYSVARSHPTPFSILLLDLQLVRYLPKKLFENIIYSAFWNYTERVAVPAVTGAAILAKRKMIDMVGGFDASYHMYGEDFEWCIRIKKGGWKIVFEPDAEIYHIGGQSSVKRWGDAVGVKMHEGGMKVQLDCLPTYLTVLNASTSVFTQGLYYAKNLITGGERGSLGKIIKIQVDGARQAIRNRNKLQERPHRKI